MTTKKWIRLAVSLWFFLWATGTVSAQNTDTITITVLYDNYAAVEGPSTDWGFSCLIEGTDSTILFDTGNSPDIFLDNIAAIGSDLDTVEHVVISHNHGDHTGGLQAFLDGHPDVCVYFPSSLPTATTEAIRETGATVTAIKTTMRISEQALLTGDLQTGSVAEQALVIQTAEEVIVVVGCAHPGIVTIVQKAREMTNRKVARVIGGFHLMYASDEQVFRIIEQLKELGVEYIGPTHCTGYRQMELFKGAFGDGYIPMGVGHVQMISVNER